MSTAMTALYLKEHFKVTSAITEAGIKLRLSETAVSTSCMIYHSCWQTLQDRGVIDIDKYLVACTSTYLASKFVEEFQKIRDVIIVFHRILHKSKPPLEIGKRYWQLRDSVVQCELLLLRLLQFEVPCQSPQKYLTHFLQSIDDWTSGNLLKECRIPRIAWNLLHDSCHLPLCVEYGPISLAVTVIYIASASSGGVICPEASKRNWWEALKPDVTESEIQEIGIRLLEIYEYEESMDSKAQEMNSKVETYP